MLIVGLGNPGKKYDDTRHNIGFRVMRALAAKYAAPFRPSLVKAKGSVAEVAIGEKKALLLMPLTYMNESGLSVRKCIDYYKIPIGEMIVVTDDADLTFGRLRIRAKGGCGGHNGLRSIESHLGTQEYPRLRIGVGRKDQGELSDYVLGRFSQEEMRAMPEIVEKAIEALEVFLREDIDKAMLKANTLGE